MWKGIFFLSVESFIYQIKLGGVLMSKLNLLVTQKLVPFKEKNLILFSEKFPILYTALSKLLDGQTCKIGFQITESNIVIGTYTLTINGVHIVHIESGSLDPELTLPWIGMIKPYVIMEKKDFEESLEEPNSFSIEILKKYIKNMK